MKKTYISPKMETAEIKMVSMIAATGGDYNPQVHKTTLDPGSAEGRRDSWFDEEEDEF